MALANVCSIPLAKNAVHSPTSKYKLVDTESRKLRA